MEKEAPMFTATETRTDSRPRGGDSSRLEVRNLKFPMAGDVPRHWLGGRKSVTSFFDNLSVFFPEGEKFFIDAIKAHKHLIHDEQLLKQVAAFCAQEGIHGREHVRYNEMLAAQGYPVVELEERVKAVLARARTLPPRVQLAATCALEHFTALMGHAVLDDPRLLDGAHPVMRSLWRWHSAEENEHKAVAYDVYEAVGISYPERAAVMLIASVVFWTLVVQHQVRFMKVDGTHRSPKEWRSLLSYLFVEPAPLTQMWLGWLHYFRPSFHPWNHDNRDLLESWKKEYAAGHAVQRTPKPA